METDELSNKAVESAVCVADFRVAYKRAIQECDEDGLEKAFTAAREHLWHVERKEAQGLIRKLFDPAHAQVGKPVSFTQELYNAIRRSLTLVLAMQGMDKEEFQVFVNKGGLKRKKLERRVAALEKNIGADDATLDLIGQLEARIRALEASK